MPWSLLIGLFTGLPGMLGDYFKRKQEIAVLKEQNESAYRLEQQKQIGEAIQNDSERATAMIGATGMNFKYVVFGILSIPFLAALTGHTEYVKTIFDNISTLPQEYRILYFSIVAVIWGIPVQGNIMGMVVEGIKGAVANHRDYKLQKLDKKAYYLALKTVKGVVTEADVKLQDAVIDELNKG